jgi:uncharacterized membrane protein
MDGLTRILVVIGILMMILGGLLMASSGANYQNVQGNSGYEWRVDQFAVDGVYCIIIGNNWRAIGIDCDWPDR